MSAGDIEKACGKFQKRIEKEEKAVKKINKSLKRQANMVDVDREVCLAFCIFNEEIIKYRMLEWYRLGRATWPMGWLARTFQSNALRFGDKKRLLFFKGNTLVLEQAPEPSNLYWENLDFDPVKRRFEKPFSSGDDKVWDRMNTPRAFCCCSGSWDSLIRL